MSARENAYVSIKIPAKNRPSPNSTVSYITVEVRCFWPSHAGNRDAVLGALLEAYAGATREIFEKDDGRDLSVARGINRGTNDTGV